MMLKIFIWRFKSTIEEQKQQLHLQNEMLQMKDAMFKQKDQIFLEVLIKTQQSENEQQQ